MRPYMHRERANMKKIIFLLSLLFIVLLFALFSLKDSLQSDKPVHENSEKNSKVIELSFGHHMPKDSLINKAALRFADEVFKKTSGRVKITVYPNQELGNSHQMVELSRQGKIDIILTATAKMSVASPSMQFADLPFLFPTRQDAYALLDGKVGEMLFKDLSKIDLLGAAFWDGGYKNFTSNKPLTKLEDFKDLKVRVMKCRVIMEQFHALKALPITIDFHATKKALKDGVVDAQENPLSEIVRMGFYKVQSDLTLSRHAYLPYVLTFSKKSISKLPLDIKNILFATAKEVTSWEREETHKKEQELLGIIKDAGVRVHTFSPKEKKRLEDATSYIIRDFEDVIGSHIVSKAQEYMYEKYPKENTVAIGVDADLSMGAKGSGLAIKRGVELAVEDINKAGGLLSKRVVVVAKDHQGVSTQASQNIKEFIDDKKVIGVIGGKHSAVISSYTKQIQDNKLIFFSPWAAAPSVTDNGYKDNYIFRVSLNDKYATKFLAQEALKHNSNPAVVVENSIWGKEALKSINKYFVSKNMHPKEGIIINRGENKFDKVFKSIKERKNDSIIMVLNAQESIKLVEYMGEHKLYFPVISHWGMVGDSFFNADKKYLKDIDLRFIQTFSLLKNANANAKALRTHFYKDYRHVSKTKINAITGVAQAYDSVMLLAHAVRKCNSFDSVKVKEALENLDSYNGVIKKYIKPFSKTDHDALGLHDFFMAKFDENGNIVPVKE